MNSSRALDTVKYDSEPDADIYYETDTDAEMDSGSASVSALRETPEYYLNRVIANKKISRFFIEHSKVSLEAIWGFQCHDGDIYYIDHNKIVRDRLTHFPDRDLILHQFDIPASDEEQQKILYELYEKTKGRNNDANAFTANEDTKPSLVAQFKYYSGYWWYSKRSHVNTELFVNCANNEKNTFLSKIKQIANNTAQLTDEIVKLEDEIKQTKKYCGLSIAFAIAVTSLHPSILLLGSVLFLLHQFYSYHKNVSKINIRLDRINKSDALLIHSIFAQQNKTPDISAHINDLRKIYVPR